MMWFSFVWCEGSGLVLCGYHNRFGPLLLEWCAELFVVLVLAAADVSFPFNRGSRVTFDP